LGGEKKGAIFSHVGEESAAREEAPINKTSADGKNAGSHLDFRGARLLIDILLPKTTHHDSGSLDNPVDARRASITGRLPQLFPRRL
jgi:hypothetical protein